MFPRLRRAELFLLVIYNTSYTNRASGVYIYICIYMCMYKITCLLAVRIWLKLADIIFIHTTLFEWNNQKKPPKKVFIKGKA